jgi:hypothetical protein
MLIYFGKDRDINAVAAKASEIEVDVGTRKIAVAVGVELTGVRAAREVVRSVFRRFGVRTYKDRENYGEDSQRT